jgi:hypothetical protein
LVLVAVYIAFSWSIDMRDRKWTPELVRRYLQYAEKRNSGAVDGGGAGYDAWEEVQAVIEGGNIDEALELTCVLVNEASYDELNYVAAGPVEDLLRFHGPEVVDRILAEASPSPKMRFALHGVWGEGTIDPAVWKKLQDALRSYGAAWWTGHERYRFGWKPAPSGRHFDIMMSARYLLDVRTTLTLEEDVAARVKSESQRSGRSFKEVVNDLLRRGLDAKRPHQPRKPFAVRARPLGVRPGLDYDNVADLLEQIEGPLAP